MNKSYIDILRKKKIYQNCYIKLSKWCIKTNSVNIIGLRGRYMDVAYLKPSNLSNEL